MNFTTHTFQSHPSGGLTLDVITPCAGAPPHPVVVWISGGGWTRMGKRGGHEFLRWLVADGFAVVPVEYRVATQAVFPAQRDDLVAAWCWLQAHATSLGLAPSRIAVMGDSAGGHLASLLATATLDYPDLPPARRVISLMPPMHLLEEADSMLNCTVDLLGGAPHAMPEQALAASPRHHFSAATPPHLFIHGGKDELVRPAQSLRAHARLEALGVPSEHLLLPTLAHNAHGLYHHPATIAAVRRFLEPLRPNAELSAQA